MGGSASTLMRPARLLDVDPELADGLGPVALQEARQARVPVLHVPPGPWSPAVLRDVSVRPFALLVVRGLVLREILLDGTVASEPLGPGDVVDHRAVADGLVPTVVRWTAAEPARIAVLDDHLLPLVRAYPLLSSRLLARATRHGSRIATQRAIAQLPRVEDRLLALFGHLAERWGRVGPAGVIVPLRLTHEMFGRLVGARRPTVSLALKDLAARGLVARRDDGAWVLRHGALDELAGDAAGGWRPPDARRVAVGGMPCRLDRSGIPHTAGVLGAEDRAALLARVRRLRETHEARVERHRAALARCAAHRTAGGGQI